MPVCRCIMMHLTSISLAGLLSHKMHYTIRSTLYHLPSPPLHCFLIINCL
ncbi:hypothetical protein RchiOBHm_Chr2g0084371 [Rosa chinensis]|uniref:Uncharacterized protein n=1 Tax=Rosa chinensis TaxID=74649 RepID=A0A2P6RHU4_ROSCH|nr:hypothetical protein RchiOBHm_Chr2g0084371 [Rosa chinensis]